jgi:FG-GAP-like repeat
MHLRGSFIGACLPLAAALSLLPAAGERRGVSPPVPGAGAGITWKKTVLDKKFRAEGVAVADVNRDGKTDVLAGEVWYEAPGWKMHEIQKPGDYGDGAQGYSHTFACWADDLNGDGWPDLIVIDYPGTPCYWLENPRGKPGHWPRHVIWHSACNETPQYADLFGTGKRVLVMAWQPKEQQNPEHKRRAHSGQLAYFTPGKDPTALWEMHPVSEPSRPGQPVPGTLQYSHGLGVGDVNGDGRPDVICTGGWWEQPGKPTGAPWKFHPADLGPDCADLFAYDLDNDGKPDILSSSAHRYGIWWHQQRPGPNGPTFLRHDLFPHLFSQTHALHFVDIDGDGLKDLVTGKRWWAHGPKGDADPNDPAKLYWFKARKNRDGFTTFEPQEIDNDSGVGTQFTVADVNGDRAPDVVVANKKGVFLFEQMRDRR